MLYGVQLVYTVQVASVRHTAPTAGRVPRLLTWEWWDMTVAATAIGGTVDRLVRWVVVPVTSLIPILVRTGALFALFGAAWIACLAAYVLRPDLLAGAWQWIGALPLVVQVVAWLLFLPLFAGVWASQQGWHPVISLVVMVGIAAWNLLVLRPGTPAEAPTA